MKPDLWQRAKEIYNSVLERQPVEREEFIAEACAGDGALRKEVESMLGWQEKAGDFIESPALEVAGRAMAEQIIVEESADLTGRRLLHYTIREKIGAGGMGVVYKARDVHLDRTVAIKVLPPSAMADPDRLARFEREAKAASALNHPNIATIHAFEEDRGMRFIVMEHVEGETLAERMRKHRFDPVEIFDIGIQVAGALEEAHGRGIVHRDIKPANIMLTTKGRVKVLDFGLAKKTYQERAAEITGASTDAQTTRGMIVGTLEYMAPEQFRNQRVDARSDLWALGVVLYEMAAGERPFKGQSAFELSSAILNQVPRPLPVQMPAELIALIERSLEKEPDRRYQRAGDVSLVLKAIQVGAASPPVARHSGRTGIIGGPIVERLRAWAFGREARIQRLAVLPFQNLSSDPEQEFFADGITEELIASLSRIRSLKVISRTSVMRYRRTDKPVRQIANELNVNGVVEGSVQRSVGQVRIRVQLIRASTDTPIWSERYQRSFSEVLTLQGEVAQAIAREINAMLTPTTTKQLARIRPVDPEAYEAYLKGQFHWYRLSPGDLDLAWSYFQSAMSKDPNCAPAHVGVANVWFMRSDTGLLPPSEGVSRAREAVLKALALDESLAVAHIALGNILALHDRNWAAGEREYRRGLDLDPNNAFGHLLLADFLISMNRPKEWATEAQQALELDPFNTLFQWAYGWELVYEGRYDEAIAQLHKVLVTEPSSSSARLGLWGAYYRKGMYAEALAEAREHFEIIHEPDVVAALSRGCEEGSYQRAMALGAEALASAAQGKYVPGVRLARMYAHAGDNDRAFHWLNIAFERHESPLCHLPVFWDWDSLRSDHRFQDLLRRMNLPQ